MTNKPRETGSDSNESEALIAASRAGRADLVRDLVTRGVFPIVFDDERFTPLHFAVIHGQLDLVRLLVQHGAPVKAGTRDGVFPIHLAETPEMIQLLLELGGDMKPTDHRRLTVAERLRLKNLGKALAVVVANPGLSVAHLVTDPRNHPLLDPFHSEVFLAVLQRGGLADVRTDTGNTPLHLCAGEAQYLPLVQALLEHQPDLEAANRYGETALGMAAAANNPGAVKLLLQRGASPNGKSRNGWSPLYAASLWGYEEVARMLLEDGARVDGREGSRGDSPLHAAAGAGSVAIVQLILKKGVDPDPRTMDGETPLFKAVLEMKRETVEFLLSKKAKVNNRSSGSWTALHWAAYKKWPEGAQLLLAAGADTTIRNNWGRTPAEEALEMHCPEVAALIRGEAAKVGIQPEPGETTAFHQAAAAGDLAALRPFVSSPAPSGWRGLLASVTGPVLKKKIEWPIDREGNTPLHLAVRNVQAAAVSLLLEAGGDPKAANTAGDVPLKMAARAWKEARFPGNRLERPDERKAKTAEGIMLSLLQAGADANEMIGDAPLVVFAVKYGLADLFEEAVRRKADLQVEDKDGTSLLHWACLNGHLRLADRLLQLGFTVDRTDAHGNTLLHSAASSMVNRKEMLRFLLSRGVKAKLRNGHGENALFWAVRLPDPTVVRLLVAAGADPDQANDEGKTPRSLASGEVLAAMG